MFRHSGLTILALGLVLLSLALSGADCPGSGVSAVQAGQDLNCVTCETTGVTLIWAVDRDDLIGVLRSSGPGWVAAGFPGADSAASGQMIVGSVVSGRPVVRLWQFSGLAVSSGHAEPLEAHAMREQGVTVVIFRARLKDLGLVGRVGRRLPVILAANEKQDDASQFRSGKIGTVTITL